MGVCSALSWLVGGIGIGFVSSSHVYFTVIGLTIDLITSPALPGYCGTVTALVTSHGVALLLLLPIFAEDLVAFGSRTTGTTSHFKKVKSETAKTHPMKALPSEAGMQKALSSRRKGGVAEIL